MGENERSLASTSTKVPKSDIKRLANAIGAEMGLRISPATYTHLVDIATEFVEALTSESVSFANKDKVNSLRPDHLMRSLEHLGFSDYIPHVNAEHERVLARLPAHRAKLARKRERLRKLDTPEMLQLQQQLFAAARDATKLNATEVARK